MLIDVFLPELGENIAAGAVTKILVKAGDALKKGQNILELETDKAVLEVPSQHNGVIKEILVKAGATVKVGQAIFKIESGASPAAATTKAVPASPAQPKAEVRTPAEASQPTTIYMPVRKDVHAAPSVRLFAREIGIDIA